MEISTSFLASYKWNIAVVWNGLFALRKYKFLKVAALSWDFQIDIFIHLFFCKFVFGINNFKTKQAEQLHTTCVEGVYCVSVPDSDTVPE